MHGVGRWIALHLRAWCHIALHAGLRLFKCNLEADRGLRALHHMVGAERLRAITKDPLMHPGEVTEVDEVLDATRR